MATARTLDRIKLVIAALVTMAVAAAIVYVVLMVVS